jgi:hypothetical protein
VHADDGIDDDSVAGLIVVNGRVERLSNGIDYHGELFGHLVKTFLGPVSEPINDASIEEGRRGGSSVGKVWVRRIHGEDHMQIPLDILDEQFIDLIVVGDVLRVVFLELTQQKHVFFSFKETRNLP